MNRSVFPRPLLLIHEVAISRISAVLLNPCADENLFERIFDWIDSKVKRDGREACT